MDMQWIGLDLERFEVFEIEFGMNSSMWLSQDTKRK